MVNHIVRFTVNLTINAGKFDTFESIAQAMICLLYTSFRRLHDLLRLHASYRNGERSRHRLLPPRRPLQATPQLIPRIYAIVLSCRAMRNPL